MESRPLLESHFGPWPTTFVAPSDAVPLLETPSGGGAAPTNWWRAMLGLADRGPGRLIAWTVLALSLALTVGAWQYLRIYAAANADRELAHDAGRVVSEIADRLGHYEQTLASVAAHHAMGGGRDGSAWSEFVERLGIERHYPEIRRVAYATWDAQSARATISFLYPLSAGGNRLVGFNVYSTPTLREAFDQAADSGATTLSGRIELVLEDGPDRNAGFGMYLPDYRAGQPLYAVADRREALQGFVYLIFRAQDFVRGALGAVPPDVRFALFDGASPEPARLLYDNLGDTKSRRATELTSPHLMRALSFGGRMWTVAVYDPPALGIDIIGRDGILLVGILMSLILFAMTGALTHSLERGRRANLLLEKRARHREAYLELSRFALVNGDVDAVVEKAFAALGVVGSDNCVLLEHVEAAKVLTFRNACGWTGQPIPDAPLSPRTSAALTLATGRPVVIRDTQSETEFDFPPILFKLGIRSSATVVVQDQDKPWGILIANSTRPHAFGADEVTFLQTVANIVAEAIRRRRGNELLHQAQKMEAVGQLTGGIAHDFNNLLTVVMGNMELLLDDPITPADHRSAMEMTVQAARRGADLTQKMLAFSRRQPLRPETIALDSIIPEMEGLLRRALGDHIELETHVSREMWKTHVDRTQLETAILNLAVNARDAMPNGGRLTIEAENTELDDTFASTNEIPRVGSYVSLTITDTGTGMPQDVLKRVFEPFFTTKEVGRGSGLGLSMVYGFVRQSGGYVKIYSEEGQGTTVRLYLPRAERRGEDARTKDARAPLGGHETVLVVEDDPMVRDLAVAMIGKLGYAVAVASNGKDALAVLDSARRIDVMFSDLVMPGGLNGAELAAEAVRRRPAIKVLLTSGYTERTVGKPTGHELGFPLISKPYRASDLAARIRTILDDDKPTLASVA
jgi:signal transduction histidine kinase